MGPAFSPTLAHSPGCHPPEAFQTSASSECANILLLSRHELNLLFACVICKFSFNCCQLCTSDVRCLGGSPPSRGFNLMQKPSFFSSEGASVRGGPAAPQGLGSAEGGRLQRNVRLEVGSLKEGPELQALSTGGPLLPGLTPCRIPGRDPVGAVSRGGVPGLQRQRRRAAGGGSAIVYDCGESGQQGLRTILRGPPEAAAEAALARRTPGAGGRPAAPEPGPAESPRAAGGGKAAQVSSTSNSRA